MPTGCASLFQRRKYPLFWGLLTFNYTHIVNGIQNFSTEGYGGCCYAGLGGRGIYLIYNGYPALSEPFRCMALC